jgi:hypothetical protein
VIAQWLQRPRKRLQQRYKKIVAEMWKLEEYFMDTFLATSGKKAPRLLILDFDATDDSLHGNQEGNECRDTAQRRSSDSCA